MAVKFGENFVAYQLDVEDRGVAAMELDAVNLSLQRATVSSSVNDLKARQKLLEWQVMLEEGDDDFRHRRYEGALATYRKISKQILELLEPKVSRFRMPEVWAEGPGVTKVLTSATVAFLQNLLPSEDPSPPILLLDGAGIDVQRLGAQPMTALMVTPTASEAVQGLVERAGVATEQGRFDEASGLYQRALRLAPADNAQLQAEILLNL